MPYDRAYQILDTWLEQSWHRSVLYALSESRVRADQLRLVSAVLKGMSRELRRCLEDHENGVTRAPIRQLPSLLKKWTSPEDIRLAAGEINPTDMRLVVQATETLANDMRSLLPDLAHKLQTRALQP